MSICLGSDDACLLLCLVRLQQSAGSGHRKQYGAVVDHVTLPRRLSERKLEHDETGYHHSLPRSTPEDARPAAAVVENESLAGNLSGRFDGVPTGCRQSVDKLTYVSRRSDVGNHRSSSTRHNYRYGRL